VKDALYAIALKNADRYEELAEFFRRMGDESRENVERTRRLLAQRVAK
jgi:hypothetical protein